MKKSVTLRQSNKSQDGARGQPEETHVFALESDDSSTDGEEVESVHSVANTYGSKNYIVIDTSQTLAITISSKLPFKKKPFLNPAQLYKIPMIPVNASFGVVTEQRDNPIKLTHMVRKERRQAGRKTDITVVFAIRRPGCGLCREHGLQLTELAQEDKNVAVVGVIKDLTGANSPAKQRDDSALVLYFYQNFFHFPLYKDEKWETFRALGNRKASIATVISWLPRMTARLLKKNIKNTPTGGDILTQGGVLIFDRKGQLRYAHHENFGELFDLDEFRQVIQDIRIEQSSSSLRESTTSSLASQSVFLETMPMEPREIPSNA